MDAVLKDGTRVRCRQDSSAMWLILRTEESRRGSVVGTEEPTTDERARWEKAIDSARGFAPTWGGVPHPEGWFTKNGAYRNEADEAAALARWRERTGR